MLKSPALHGIPESPQAAEQPGREFARPGPVTRAQAAAVQIGRLGAAVLVDACRDLQHVQHLPPPRHCPHAPPLSRRGVYGMAEYGWRRGISLRRPASSRPRSTTRQAPTKGSISARGIVIGLPLGLSL